MEVGRWKVRDPAVFLGRLWAAAATAWDGLFQVNFEKRLGRPLAL